MICVLEVEPRPVHIKTYSQYVLSGCGNCDDWAAAWWQKKHNCDLWKRLHALLQARRQFFAISKVKGHVTLKDVERGRASLDDKIRQTWK